MCLPVHDNINAKRFGSLSYSLKNWHETIGYKTFQ